MVIGILPRREFNYNALLKRTPYLPSMPISNVRFWGKSGQTIASQNPRLSAVSPIADKRRCGWNVRFMPKADIARLV
jgi:hypothetical protein